MRKRMLAIGLIGPAATALTLFIAAAPTTQAAAPNTLRSFGVSGLMSSVAGAAQTVKVTALTNGKANSAYRGTVVLTSTDAKAAGPTFTVKSFRRWLRVMAKLRVRHWNRTLAGRLTW